MVYEADDRVEGPSLPRETARCNFSNEDVRAGLYRNADFVGSALLDFEIRACSEVTSQRKRSTSYGSGVLGFFSDCGLCWRGESEEGCIRWRTRRPRCSRCCAPQPLLPASRSAAMLAWTRSSRRASRIALHLALA